jgi:hypothetical protein
VEASRQATRKRKVDSSVARKRLCSLWLHVVRSLGMTDVSPVQEVAHAA